MELTIIFGSMSAQRVLSATEKTNSQTSIPIASFVKWNKTGDQIWVVIAATSNNYLIRSLPNAENTYETQNANYVNLILVKSARDLR